MIETVSKKVSPDSEQSTINFMANFGWSLQSSQEINNTDSHLERRGDEIYSVTTKENYVKLVFQRDTNMPNYARISELESKYLSLLNKEPDAPQFNLIIAGILLVMYIVPGVIYIVRYSKKKKEYDQQYAAWRSEMNKDGQAMLSEAASLAN